MGDKYVVQKFGREANTFCKSALKSIQSEIKGGRIDAAQVLANMRQGLNATAGAMVQGNVGTGKYTSAHIKPGYIEFRSPGGDYLAEANVDMQSLENTMLRFARAMKIAGDPTAEREEYAKKLYKLVAPEGNDALKYFAQYAAGELPKAALKSFVKQAQQQRQVAKGVTSGTDQTDRQEKATPLPGSQSADANYEIVDRRTMQPVFLMIAMTPQDAERKYRDWLAASGHAQDTSDYAWRERARALPGSTMDLAQQRSAAATQNATNPLWRDELQNHINDLLQNQVQAAAQPQGAFTGRWLIRDTSTGQTLYAFGGIGNSQADANRYAAQWVQANAPIGTDMTEVEVVPEMGAPVSEGRDLKEAASDYELHDREKLDQVLKKCCRMVIQGQQRNPEKYGQVAACVIDPENRQIFGINLPGPRGTRRHAERVAIDRYCRDIGEVPQGSIIVTTCSPCNSPMDERAGESCKDLLNSVGIHKVYAGYEDPTQHDDRDADFRTYVTGEDDLWSQCQLFAQTF